MRTVMAAMKLSRLVLALLVLAVSAPAPLHAYIERLYSLAEVLGESTHVAVGKVKSVDRGKKVAVAVLERALKGGLEFQEVQMNLGLAAPDHTAYVLGLLERDAPFLLFYKGEGDNIASCFHSGETWVQLFSNREADPRRMWWRMTHIEIYMDRTYRGETKGLIQLVEEVLGGKAKPPPPDPKVPALDVSRPRPRRRPAAKVDTLVERGSSWRYRMGGAGTSGAGRPVWPSAELDDGDWASGKAPLGYGDPPLGTVLAEMRPQGGRSGHPSLLLRRKIAIAGASGVQSLDLEIDYDDGFILWINGKEALSANRPAGDPGPRSLASGQHEAGAYEPFSIDEPGRYLVEGTNVIALQVFNASLSSSDLKIDVEVKAVRGPARGAAGGFRLAGEWKAGGEPRGAALLDLEGDGRPEVHLLRSEGSLLLGREGGTESGLKLADRAQSLGLAAGSRSAAWADFDLDGRADLLTEQGLFALKDGRLSAGPKLPGHDPGRARAAGWIDANGDGLPDALLSQGSGLRLLLNTGKGPEWFREAPRPPGIEGGGAGMAAASLVVSDYDGDGYADIVHSLAKGLLLRNGGDGAYQEDAAAAIRAPFSDPGARPALGDLDNDGDLDLFHPGDGKARLFRNRNDGAFEEASPGPWRGPSGDPAGAPGSTRSAALGDVNGDGFPDLFACLREGKSLLFLSDGAGGLQDATERAGLSGLDAAFAALGDLDGDGDLDLAVNLADGAAVFINEMPLAAGRGWLTARIAPRKGATGTRVRVEDPSGKLLGLRELPEAPLAHFALPLGPCRVSAVLGDGTLVQETVEIRPGANAVTLLDAAAETK